MGKFLVEVKKATEKGKKRILLTQQLAVQRMVDDISIPRHQGGRLPFDTGFLQHSINAAIGNPPIGVSQQKEGMGDPGVIPGILAQWKSGEVLYVGWTAEYAGYVDVRYGFHTAGAQLWTQYVREALAEAKRAV